MRRSESKYRASILIIDRSQGRAPFSEAVRVLARRGFGDVQAEAVVMALHHVHLDEAYGRGLVEPRLKALAQVSGLVPRCARGPRHR